MKRELVVSLAVTVGGRVLLSRRPDHGLWAGLWELPGTKPLSGESRQATVGRIWRTHAHGRTPEVAHYTTLVHQLTHRTYTFDAYVTTTTRAPKLRSGLQTTRWASLGDEPNLALSAATRKLLAALPAGLRS